MSKLSEDKREVLAYIDAILTMIEKYPTLNLNNILGDVNLGASVNPFSFLLSIIKKQATDSEMIDWLVNILTVSLPAIELGVKGVLLSNLKQTIDCNNDPRIPLWLRQNIQYSAINNPSVTNNDERGFIFNLKNIDYMNLLSYSPLSEQGQMKYFGTKSYYEFSSGNLAKKKFYSYYDAVIALQNSQSENQKGASSLDNLVKKSEISNVYELARANDFNAFLWFVINKANFVTATEIEIDDISNYTIEYTLEDGTIQRKPFSNAGSNSSILECLTANFRTSDKISSPFSPGNTLLQKSTTNGKYYYNVISLCMKMTSSNISLAPIEDDNGLDYGDVNVIEETVVSASAPKDNTYTFVPVSSNYKSANWYVNSGTYFNFLLPENKRVTRDYTKDFAICNIEPLSISDLQSAKVNGEKFKFTSQETYIRFTILPAPLIHTPYISISIDDKGLNYTGEPPINFRRILFNEKGDPDNNGKYTVLSDTREDDIDKKITTYSYGKANGERGKVEVSWEDGSYRLCHDDGDDGYKADLIECYPGLTVYDFNYNYVMGMQLFDPAVVASQLIDMATNITAHGSLGLNLSINKTETAYQMRIAEIVKNIINSTAYEASDCFYSFSNSQYDDMLNQAELKRAQGYPFSNSENHAASPSLDEAYSILSEFDDNATLEENKDVITRAITQATASITDEVLPEDKYNIKLNLIEGLIEGLVMIIVESLLTPKIILLFEVNKQLMGGHDENLTLEDFLQSLSGLITAIVIEIRDLILKELLNWALSILKDLLSKLSSMLALEQVEYYTRLMAALLKACKIKLPHRKIFDNELDYVDYADIDETEEPKQLNVKKNRL